MKFLQKIGTHFSPKNGLNDIYNRHFSPQALDPKAIKISIFLRNPKLLCKFLSQIAYLTISLIS